MLLGGMPHSAANKGDIWGIRMIAMDHRKFRHCQRTLQFDNRFDTAFDTYSSHV